MFSGQYFMQFKETSLNFLLQISRHHNFTTLFAIPSTFAILILTLFVEIYSMFLHLCGQLLHGNTAVCIGVHFLEEKFDLLFLYFGMNMFYELSEFLVGEL